MKLVLFALAVVFTTTAAFAQESTVLDERRIDRWLVTKLETPSSGLSCQALRCNTRTCDNARTATFFRLWGSARRQAITPMLGADFAYDGVQTAVVDIGERRFAFEQRVQSTQRLYIAKNARDDVVIMRLIANTPSEDIVFRTELGAAAFKLSGLTDVLAYFTRECGIPRP